MPRTLLKRIRDTFLDAGDRNRTGTMSPPQDFKSCASASSATAAYRIEKQYDTSKASMLLWKNWESLIICMKFWRYKTFMAQWLSWLERRPVTAEVEGSNPFRVV